MRSKSFKDPLVNACPMTIIVFLTENIKQEEFFGTLFIAVLVLSISVSTFHLYLKRCIKLSDILFMHVALLMFR